MFSKNAKIFKNHWKTLKIEGFSYSGVMEIHQISAQNQSWKLIKQSYLFYLYASVELIIASLLTIYSVIQSNYILLIIGSLLFLSSVYSFWKREELLFQTEQLGNQYEYIGAFMCFFLAALIYFFDSASSVT